MQTISKVEKFKYQEKLFDSEEEAAIYAATLLITGTEPDADISLNLKKNARGIITFLQKVKESA
jgi:hypothetical protein